LLVATPDIERETHQAGDVTTSRRLLQSIFPEETVQRSLSKFADNVRRRDRPRAPDEWLPPESG